MADNYKFSQDYELIAPQKQISYPISISEWTIIKSKISGIKDSANFWHTLGSILLGASISTLITALINDFNTEKLLWTCWFVFVITGISGGLSFYFGKQQRVTHSQTKIDVLDFMGIIEERFQNANPSVQVKQKDAYEIHSARYAVDRNYIDVSQKLREYLSKGIFEILVTNETMGGDPYHGKHKILEVDLTLNGIRKQISVDEKEVLKIK
jgi:hypothetical protein